MSYELFLFLTFTFFLIISSCCCLLSKNAIHSMVFLILIFCNISLLLLLLNVEFLGLLFLIVYVGAIAILFIFIVMMLNIRTKNEYSYSFTEFFFFFALFAFMVCFLIIYFDAIININVVFERVYNLHKQPEFLWGITFGANTLDLIGFFLYPQYPGILILVGLVLFIGLVGAIVISFNNDNIQLRLYSLWRHKRVHQLLGLKKKKYWYL